MTKVNIMSQPEGDFFNLLSLGDYFTTSQGTFIKVYLPDGQEPRAVNTATGEFYEFDAAQKVKYIPEIAISWEKEL